MADKVLELQVPHSLELSGGFLCSYFRRLARLIIQPATDAPLACFFLPGPRGLAACEPKR